MTWIEAPKSSDPIELAHYVETELLVSGEEYLSIAESSRRLDQRTSAFRRRIRLRVC